MLEPLQNYLKRLQRCKVDVQAFSLMKIAHKDPMVSNSMYCQLVEVMMHLFPGTEQQVVEGAQ